MQRYPSIDIARVALCAALITVSSFVAIPIGSVPFTLQVFAVLLAGLTLGARLGAASVLVYLLLGLIAPVYAGGTGGVGVLAGPTGGYLIGFVPAAGLAGLVRTRVRPAWSLLPALLGLLAVYVVGSAWLAWQLHLEGLRAILSAGVLPFVPFDVVKALLAAAVARVLLSLPLGLPEPQRGRPGRPSPCREVSD